MESQGDTHTRQILAYPPRVTPPASSHPYARQTPSRASTKPTSRQVPVVPTGITVLVASSKIIPAYAGSTRGDGSPQTTAQDHPRVCGEHGRPTPATADCLGSSPRMRGARRVDEQVVDADGIIPAYAGSTTTRTSADMPPGDHPRVCGEHRPSAALIDAGPGSSPRMRGALQRHRCCCRRHGGSSPRMRGARVRQLWVELYQGIIPAYAGSTYPYDGHCLMCRDHPRVCGEHRRWCAARPVLLGSSPRMRGAHVQARGQRAWVGIIPAYAGSTHDRDRCRAQHRDHPRVCGEHVMLGRIESATAGSSPRMRGALAMASETPCCSGIIPAYAGSTPPARP